MYSNQLQISREKSCVGRMALDGNCVARMTMIVNFLITQPMKHFFL